jgi:hypothetical protein
MGDGPFRRSAIVTAFAVMATLVMAGAAVAAVAALVSS